MFITRENTTFCLNLLPSFCKNGQTTVYGDDFLLVAPDKYIVDAKDKLLPILEGSSFIINFQKGTVKPLKKY